MKNAYVYYHLKNFFNVNKLLVLFISAFCLFGIITGAFTCLKQTQAYSLNLVQNIALKKFLLKDCGYFGFLFISLFFNCLLLIFGFFLSCFRFGKWVLFGFAVYLAYLIGIDFIVIFNCFNAIKGAIISTCVYVVWRFLLLVLFSIFIFRASFYNTEMFHYGRCSIKDVSQKLFLTFLTITSTIIFIQSIVMLVLLKLFIFI